jgi:hypothetical protein
MKIVCRITKSLQSHFCLIVSWIREIKNVFFRFIIQALVKHGTIQINWGVASIIMRICFPMKADLYLLISVIALLLFPLPFSKPENGKRINIDLPSVYNGDEPHYLLMMSSIVNDGDLDLKNNYLAVHEGSAQAGKRFAGTPFEHQTFWYVNDKYFGWWDAYEDQWGPGDSGRLKPRTKDTVVAKVTARLPEYGAHPPGLALFLAPALYPFKNSMLFEPMAIFYAALIMVAALFFCRYLLCAYTTDSRRRTMCAAIIFLGSPLWFYARTLYSEGTMTFLAVAAYALFISGKKALVPGLLIGLGVLFKPVFGILAVPLFFTMARNKEMGKLVRFSAAVFTGIAILFLLNYRMSGSFLKATQLYIMGNPLSGAWGLFSNTTHGILLLCPAFLIALTLWPSFIRKHGYKAWIPAWGFLLYFIVMATFANWRGGDSYGPRLIVPVLPFLLLPLLLFPAGGGRWKKLKTGLGVFLILISIYINANGAITSWKFINRNPLIAAYVKVGKLLF